MLDSAQTLHGVNSIRILARVLWRIVSERLDIAFSRPKLTGKLIPASWCLKMTGTKVLVTIPLELYRVLEQKCKFESLEFRMLKSGLIVNEGGPLLFSANRIRPLG